MSQLLNGASPPHFGQIQNVLEEVNKQEIQENPALPVQELVEISFESDVDFWNMLDGLNSSLPLEIQMQNEEDHKSINNHGSSSNLGEIENKKGSGTWKMNSGWRQPRLKMPEKSPRKFIRLFRGSDDVGEVPRS
ncbi:hypothetical protein M5689_021851 [Euphorbia peplus]|nr:hypothetical protein M5689_021851 [Euphorbia peplus]